MIKERVANLMKIIDLMQDESIRKAFAVRLKQLRKERGLTQKEVAALIDIGPSQYNKYEMGIYAPPIDKIARLAESLKVSLDYLILGEVEQQLKMKNKELIEKIQDIENLSNDDQAAMIRMIDAMIIQQKIEAMKK